MILAEKYYKNKYSKTIDKYVKKLSYESIRFTLDKKPREFEYYLEKYRKTINRYARRLSYEFDRPDDYKDYKQEIALKLFEFYKDSLSSYYFNFRLRKKLIEEGLKSGFIKEFKFTENGIEKDFIFLEDYPFRDGSDFLISCQKYTRGSLKNKAYDFYRELKLNKKNRNIITYVNENYLRQLLNIRDKAYSEDDDNEKDNNPIDLLVRDRLYEETERSLFNINTFIDIERELKSGNFKDIELKCFKYFVKEYSNRPKPIKDKNVKTEIIEDITKRFNLKKSTVDKYIRKIKSIFKPQIYYDYGIFNIPKIVMKYPKNIKNNTFDAYKILDYKSFDKFVNERQEILTK